MTDLSIPDTIKQISDTIWEIPVTYKEGMRVPARICATKKLIENMANEVPIYTSHMLLNILPANILYEAISHLNEGIFRLEPIIKENPSLVQAYDDLKRNLLYRLEGHTSLSRQTTRVRGNRSK